MDYWELSWKDGSYDWMDPFDDAGNATVTGDAVVQGGNATTPNIVMDDRFWRLDKYPWRDPSDKSEIRTGGLWLESGGTVEMDLPDLTEFTLDTIVTLKAIDVAGPRIDLTLSISTEPSRR
jgi:hypothetical protein